MPPLHELTAEEGVRALHAGEVSSEDLVEAALARAVDDRWGSFLAVDAEGARARAREIDAMPERPPLAGVPIAIKDALSTRDIPTTAAASELKGDCETRKLYDPTAVCEAEPVAAVQPGMGPAVVGTLITTAVSAALAVPLGIMAAIYLNEYGKRNRLARLIRFLTDVMTGVPSVVMGIFVYTLWVLELGQGRSAFAASLALACLMLPIVVRSSEEMLRLVPNALREGSAFMPRTYAQNGA